MEIDVKDTPLKCKVYKRRWIMLLIFFMCSITSYMQWIEYSIIADSVSQFYGISYEAVNWTSMTILLVFIPSIFPCVYLINRLGLRKSLLLATLATCAATWVKVGAVAQDRFWVYMVAQSIIGLFQAIFVALPVPVAATWFGQDEVSTACSLGVLGTQMGVAIGFVFPPMIVHSNSIIEDIESSLYILTIGAALFCTLISAITFVAFEDEPPLPPSIARMKSKAIGKIDFLQSILRIIKNRSYIILTVSYGINVGIFYGLSTLLNQIILEYYPDSSEDAGRIGVVTVLAGMVGAITFGIIMDKFQQFRGVTFGGLFGSFVSVLALTFGITEGLPVVYAISALVGFFAVGSAPIGFEVAAELTYPEPECISSGFVVIIAQIIGITFTYLYSYLFYNVGNLYANLTSSGLLLISSLMVFFIRFDLKRQTAQLEDEKSAPQS